MTQLVRVVADSQATAGSEGVHRVALNMVLVAHRVGLKVALVARRKSDTPEGPVVDRFGPRSRE